MKLSELNFQNHFKKLGTDFFKESTPVPLKNSSVKIFSKPACDLIDLDYKEVKSEKFLDEIFQNQKFCNISQTYAGHQFGHLVPLLGDGRAVLLAQVTNQKNQSWDLVLKGSGLTPFSRPYVQNADGRAVLRSSIREFLISESMFHLGVPTSRALCLIGSDEIVLREAPETAAQIIRLAPSHVRFGTFEYFFYRKENDKIKTLADYIIQRHPELVEGPHQNKYAGLLAGVVKSTAKLVANWQAFGFCHGVLNTDNMSIHGITFDYGPFGFLDAYNPNHICNHTDQQGRYSFVNQPYIGMWNLHAFAVTLSSLVPMEEQKEILENYEQIFLQEYHQLMAAKLGFERVDEDVKKLIYEILHLLEKHQIDYTFFFANLSSNQPCNEEISNWLKKRSALNPVNSNLANPKFILRNHLLQTAIEKAEAGDFSEVKKLLEICEKPFEENPKHQGYYDIAPLWAKEICISCSS